MMFYDKIISYVYQNILDVMEVYVTIFLSSKSDLLEIGD